MLLETREDKWSVRVVAFEDVQSGLPVSIPYVKGKPTKVLKSSVCENCLASEIMCKIFLTMQVLF